MAIPPPDAQFKKSDFPATGLGSQDSLDKLFLQLNSALQGSRKALSGALTFGQNFNCEIKTFTLTVPATGFGAASPWTAPTLSSGWSLFAPSGFPIRYRKDAGGTVWVEGLGTNASAGPGSAFVLPTGFRPEKNQITSTIISTAGTTNFGRLDCRADGNVGIYFGTPSTWGSFSGSFLASDSTLPTCFPYSMATKVVQPVGIMLLSAFDKSSSPGIPALGNPSWIPLADGKIQITNIPGLLLGRVYQISLLVVGG